MGMFTRLFRRTPPVRHDADAGDELVREIHQARTDIQSQAAQSIQIANVATSRSHERAARLERGQSFLTDHMTGPEPSRDEGAVTS